MDKLLISEGKDFSMYVLGDLNHTNFVRCKTIILIECKPVPKGGIRWYIEIESPVNFGWGNISAVVSNLLHYSSIPVD